MTIDSNLDNESMQTMTDTIWSVELSVDESVNRKLTKISTPDLHGFVVRSMQDVFLIIKCIALPQQTLTQQHLVDSTNMKKNYYSNEDVKRGSVSSNMSKNVNMYNASMPMRR